MRLLFLNHNVARRGGTFYRAYHAARYLVRRGHTVTLLTISAERRWGFQREESEGVEIIHTPDLLWGIGRTGWDLWDTLNRVAYLRGRTWDITHAWDCRPAVILPALFARWRSRRIGGKLVTDWCDWWGRGGTQAERAGGLAKRLYSPIETYFEEAFRARAEGTTVISQALYQRALALGVCAETLRILPQGCDIDEARPVDRAEARRRLGLPETAPLVVCVGALTQSEAGLLFETLRLLFRRQLDCRVVMIGNHRAHIPPDLKSCPRLIETGFVADATLEDYMAACDALLTPLTDTIASRARWPSKVNPFLAAGRTTVITRVGDLAALLEREQAALVPSCEPEAIVDSLVRLFDDPALRTRCEAQARHVARDILAWPLLVAELENLYTNL